MAKKLLFISLFLLGTMPLIAQTQTEEGTVCITHGYHEELRAQYPQIPSEEVYERHFQQAMAESYSKAQSREILRIPVVVHIIHNGEAVGSGANIPLDHVLSQMQVLQEDFRKLPGTPGDNDNPVSIDSEIEFCLAYLDPDGKVLEELGVDRVDATQMNFTSGPYSSSYIDQVIKPQTSWDPTRYMNVWVVDGISGGGGGQIAGYAFRPAAVGGIPGLPITGVPPSIDGFVVDRDFFGRQGSSDGRTATHEIGHWLGLNHLAGPHNAGSSNLSCDTDDFCDDTPNTESSLGGCNGRTTCGTEDATDNYMIGFVANCRNAFTTCQVERMRAVLLNSSQRLPLLSSAVCDRPTTPPSAAFTVGETQTCDGRVEFFDESTDIPTQWFWLFGDGQTSEERNPVVQYQAGGTYSVTLIASNEKGASSTIMQIEVNLVGGTVDAGDDIQACQGDEIQLNATTSVENGTVLWFPTTGISDPTSLNTTLTPGNVRQYILNIKLENGCNLRDTIIVDVATKPTTLILPTTDVTIDKGASISLNAIGAETYKWSPEEGLSDPNIPNPVASPEGTTTYTVTGFNKEGCSSTDDITININFPDAIDDGIWTGVGEVYPLFPNPASSQFALSAKFSLKGKLNINLLDVNGRKITELYNRQVNTDNFSYEWKREFQIAAGFYLVEWKLEGRRFMQKIQLY